MFREYRVARLADDIQEMIHKVAMNPGVSREVIDLVKSGVFAAHTEYLKLSRTSIIIALVPILLGLISPFVRPFTETGYLLLTGDGFLPNPFWLWEIAVAYYALKYFDWRRSNASAYVADYLTRALRAGLDYRNDPTDFDLRDTFAGNIQRAAIRYATIYRKAEGHRTIFFAAQVRSTAKRCRDDIISLIPGLVTADQEEIENINSDLARLIIRSQTGYWHQTSDLARHGAPMPKRSAIGIATASFIRDRSIQVAIIALVSALIGTVASLAIH